MEFRYTLRRGRNLAALFLGGALALSAADFYVAPTGTSGGYGTQSWPWDLQTALNHPTAVKPGDTIWLRGGVYLGKYQSRLTGTLSAPIQVRSFPGERAIIDSNTDILLPATLQLNGRDAWYRDLEIRNSHPKRVFETSGSNPYNARPTGVNVEGARIKVINCIIHDHGSGMGTWAGADDSEIYGNLIFNNGWDAPDRGHGHSIYGQNRNGTKRIAHNIYFNAFSHGIHIYGSGTAYLDNFIVEGNIGFNNGRISATGITRNILFGGDRTAQNGVVKHNSTYFSPDSLVGQNNFGYRAGCNNLRMEGNYFANSANLLVNCTAGAQIQGNMVHFSSNFAGSQFPANTFAQGRPTGTKVMVYPNEYEAGRAHIAIYNWDGSATVTVALNNVLNPGDRYEIRDAENFLDAPIATGTYNGAVSIPMTGTRFTPAVGTLRVAQIHTSSEFGAFVIQRAGTSNTVPSTPTPPVTPLPPANLPPTVDAGRDQTITLPSQANLNGTVSDDGLPSGTLARAWTKIAGPGAVTFSAPNAGATTAAFSVAGQYTLRLTATDGLSTALDELVVTVNPAPTPAPSPAPLPTTVRINAGGSAFTDANGDRWEADRDFTGGSTYQVDATIAAPAASSALRTLRYGAFGYRIPIANGTYTVRLKFAELYFPAPQQRIFGVNLQGQSVLRNFDIFVAAGGFRRFIERQFPVTVNNGQIQLDLVTQHEYPQVNGIEIVPSGSTPAPPPATTVAVAPNAVTVQPGQTIRLTATVMNAGNTAVNWTLSPPLGTMSTAGDYTAPSSLTQLQTVVARATSVSDPTKFATATLTLKPAPVAAPASAIRINAGAAGFRDQQGNTWLGDTGATGGATFVTQQTVAGTAEQSLYKSCRFGVFSYRLNVPSGMRKVKLRFAEPYFSTAGRRVFDVRINGVTVLSSFDIAKEAGGGWRPVDYQFDVPAPNGQLVIDFVQRVENPMVSGIEVF